MVFAAGRGTRLRPLTDYRPKALIDINGVPLLEIAIRRLQYFGVGQIIVNVHHFADQIEQFLREKDFPGMEITISDEREQLLDTGGGLKNAAWFFDEAAPFIVYNADIITSLDLGAMYRHHVASGAIATLAIQQRNSSRRLLLDSAWTLKGWHDQSSGITRWGHDTPELPIHSLHSFAFSGIHIVDPRLLTLMPAVPVFSMIDLYLQLCGRITIKGYSHTGDIWVDVGKPESIARAALVIDSISLR